MANNTYQGQFYIDTTTTAASQHSLPLSPPPQQPLPPLPLAAPRADILANSSKEPLKSPKSKKSRQLSKPLPSTPATQPRSSSLPTKSSALPNPPTEPLPPLPLPLFGQHDLPLSPPPPPTPSKSTALSSHDQDHMLSTPLPDYKHAANQTQKSRAAALEAAKAQRARKASQSTSASAERERNEQLRKNALARSGSVSSTTNSSGLTAVTTRRSAEENFLRPFTRRNGRRYLRDPTLAYPLPCDLTEIHRQTLRTMLLCQVFGGPTCSPAFAIKPPKRVLEVGCGTGFWSVRCHKYFSQRGWSNVSFTGLDIAPLAQRIEDSDMNWRFIAHDLRNIPLPFRDGEFGLVMVKDMSLVTMGTAGMKQELMDEYLRILKPGGTLEIWDGDHSIRMLLQHSKTPSDEPDINTAPGTYTITPQTPFAAPQNQYLLDYNNWISKALEKKQLTPMPCTSITPMLLQEVSLTEIDSKRLAIPLSEVRWEREGVGGVTKGKAPAHMERKQLTGAQSALRRTALMTVVQMIESLEPVLRGESGKGTDEWDRWLGGLMSDLLKGNGTGFGECLEVGAWWARKRKVGEK